MHKKFEILTQIVHITAFLILYYDLTFMISCKYVRCHFQWYMSTITLVLDDNKPIFSRPLLCVLFIDLSKYMLRTTSDLSHQ